MEWQLRVTGVDPAHAEECLAAWVAGVVPLRRRFGFVLAGAWWDEAGSELVWVLGYGGDDGFEAADRRYYESAERAALDPDPARWFRSADARAVRAVVPPLTAGPAPPAGTGAGPGA